MMRPFLEVRTEGWEKARVGRRWQILLAGGMAVCLLAGAPAANAVFTSTFSAVAAPLATHKLATPSGKGECRLTTTMTNHGTVAKANSYVLNINDLTGLAAAPVDLTTGGTHTAPSAGSKWMYSIDAKYKVPGTSCFWSSDPNPVTVC